MSGFGKSMNYSRAGRRRAARAFAFVSTRTANGLESIMVRKWSVIAALAALALGAGGAAMAQSESKPKRAQPAPLAMVEAVQMPAWVERGGASRPLAPGIELKNNDQVKTGPGARLLLRTVDGSAVKLGEKGSVFLGGMQMRGSNVFEATLKVAEGAFRFTSEVFEQFRGRRDVNIS